MFLLCGLVYSIHFLCEPLKVGHLPYPFPRANVAKIIRCISLQSWSFFLSDFKFYSAFSRKRFSWPGLFRTWFIFSDWFLHVSFSRFQYSNLHFGSLLHCFIKLSFAIGYSFAKDFCPSLLLFICKGLLSILVLSCSFGFCYMFTKDRSPCLPVYLQDLQQAECEPRGLKSSSTVVLLVEKPFMRLQTGAAD